VLLISICIVFMFISNIEQKKNINIVIIIFNKFFRNFTVKIIALHGKIFSYILRFEYTVIIGQHIFVQIKNV
jgi:hypothetical protein